MTEIIKSTPPFNLTPAFKDYIWGGTRLKTQFHKRTELPIVAESWELSVHPDGQSTIASGEYAGYQLGDIITQHPELCVTDSDGLQELPILIKLIDAEDILSIQVHPGDEYAHRVEGEPGKTEAWIIIDCDDDAFIYYGFSRAVSKEEIRRRIAQKTLVEVLYKKPVKPGDTVFIPAGTVHAIGKGILLAEVQQSSDVTYRVYDFDRMGVDGKPRALHIDKALDVMSLTPTDAAPPGRAVLAVTNEYDFEQLISCPNFNVQRLYLNGGFIYPMNQKSFAAFLCVDGVLTMESEQEQLAIGKGDCVFVPANLRGVFLKGLGQVLIITR